jgi:hypothetical protein
VADEREDKPEGEAPAEETDGSSSEETAVGHSVVEEPTAQEPARETAVGHQVVDAGAADKPADTKEVFFSRDEPGATQPAAAPPTPPGGTSPAGADRAAAESHDQFQQKPEIFIAGAFVGAFVIGKLLKKLTGSD